MKEYRTTLDITREILQDIDPSENGFYIGLTNTNNVVTKYSKFKIPGSFNFPIIRQLTEESFIIADTRTNNRELNCVIYNYNGNILEKFYIGDGIQDIEVVRDRIIVTYFDEGVYGAEGPNNEGLVIFSQMGDILFKYNEKHGYQKISDCYCICKHGRNRVLFFFYTDFQLSELNVDTGEEKIYEIPDGLKGSASLVSKMDVVYFHSPFGDEGGLYKWKMGGKQIEKIGHYDGDLRGLENGFFVTKGENGFTILEIE